MTITVVILVFVAAVSAVGHRPLSLLVSGCEIDSLRMQSLSGSRVMKHSRKMPIVSHMFCQTLGEGFPHSPIAGFIIGNV